MAGPKAKRPKAKRAKAKSKVSSKKARKNKRASRSKTPSRRRASTSRGSKRTTVKSRGSADGALRSELGSARAAIKEHERRIRDLTSVLKALGAPKGNGAVQRSYAARVRTEAALSHALKKQLDSLKGQHKTSTARLLGDVAKLKKLGAAAKSQSSKSAAKFKSLQSQLAERDKRIKVLRGGAKQAESLQRSVASLEKQKTAVAQRSKQLQEKVNERAVKLGESVQLLKKELAAKSKQARDGSRAVVQSQKLGALLALAKDEKKKFAEQLKLTEQRAKEMEKRLEVIDKKAKALEEKRNTPMVLAQASNRLQFKPLTPAPKKLFEAAKTRIKTAEEKLKITPPAVPARPKRAENVDDELPFDEEDFEEEVELDEEEEEEPAEGGDEGGKGEPKKKTKPKKQTPPDGDDEEPLRDDDS